MADKNDKSTPEQSGKTLKNQKGRGKKHPEQQKAEQEQDRHLPETEPVQPKKQAPEPGRQQAFDPKAKAPGPGRFPIICIGASAGGLEAIESFVANLPDDSGLAFVIITHTDPEHTSMLPELVQRKSRVKVVSIKDGMTAEPDTIFIPPSDRNPVIEKEVFRLNKRPGKSELNMPIDLFCKHLAKELGERCGCIILSGTGTDGSQGLRLIKEKAGLVMAQDKKSARHAGMPTSAVETGLVDFVLSPAEMPERLIEYFKNPAAIQISREQQENKEPDPLRRILAFIANSTKHDFSLYKDSTLIRRIERRMTVTRNKNASEYLNFLHHNPPETRALFQDLLIGVTSFFRDPETFGYLKRKVLPNLIKAGSDSEPIRVWTPGCSTGEEAFSVAMLITECLEEQVINREMQIFATDIDPKAIEKARQGAYVQNIAADVSHGRLKRFFNKIGDKYHVKNEIREPVVFAEQNVLRDPPFSNLDLIVCRNLLIYLKPEAQNKLLPLFHYTLKEKGILFLGTSESVGRFPELFEPLSKTHRLYQKTGSAIRPKVYFPTGAKQFRGLAGEAQNKYGEKPGPGDTRNLPAAVEKELLKNYTPPCVIVNLGGEIMYIHGQAGKYLEPSQGKFSSRISEMAREGLRFTLLRSLRRARENPEQTIREHGLRIKVDGGYQRLTLTVKAVDQPALKDCLMVIFEDISEAPEPETRPNDCDSAAESRIQEMESELMRVNQDYRSALEELETSNEELKSTNEEMHSSTEELQSSNEELESSREELQSLNEELSTVNSELHRKINELDEAYNAITHVLSSTRIAIVFLNTEMRVQRFTAEAGRLLNLIESDVGRPIDHIAHNLKYENLAEKARQVLEYLTVIEEPVRSKEGNWYRMAIRVHRTAEHVILGVVITFISIDEQIRAQMEPKVPNGRKIASAENMADSLIDMINESVLVLDLDMNVIRANRQFYKTFQTSAGQTEGKNLFALSNGNWDTGDLRRLLRQAAEGRVKLENHRTEQQFDRIGVKHLQLSARKLPDDDQILLLITPENGLDATHG